MRLFIASLVALAAFSTSAAQATETIKYTYDTKGLLINVCQATSTSAFTRDYVIDRAQNRQRFVGSSTTLNFQIGNSLLSDDGRFSLVMQGDNHLVLYGPTGALWWSNTVGSGANLAAFQSDGNLVLYGPSGAVWASNTQSHCAALKLQNDGNLVIRNTSGDIIWSTNTGGH